LHRYKTLSFTVREEHKSRVSGNRIIRGILESKREEVVEDWRELHCEELYNLYASEDDDDDDDDDNP
jgi:hypothetical protein